MLPLRKLSCGYFKHLKQFKPFKPQPKRFLSDKSSKPNPDSTKKQLDKIVNGIDALVFLNLATFLINIFVQTNN